MTVCSRALCLPEIVSRIVQKLDSVSDVISCATVCQLWRGEAMRIFWRGDDRINGGFNTPFVEHLAKMQQLMGDAFPKMLSYVRFLDIRSRAKGLAKRKGTMEALKGLSLHRSRAIVLNIHFNAVKPPHHENVFETILQPHLRAIVLGLDYYGPSILRLIQNAVPRLESIEIENMCPDKIEADQVLQFLVSMPCLRIINGLGKILSEEMLEHLMQRPMLESVSLQDSSLDRLLPPVLKKLAAMPLFKDLRMLEVESLETNQLTLLLSQLEKIECLELATTCSEEITFNKLIRSLTSYSAIREIKLFINLPSDRESFIDGSSLIEQLRKIAQNSPRLTHLTLHTFANGFICFEIDESLMVSLCEGMRCTEVLELPFAVSFSPQGLYALPSKSPNLNKLKLGRVEFDFKQFSWLEPSQLQRLDSFMEKDRIDFPLRFVPGWPVDMHERRLREPVSKNLYREVLHRALQSD